MDRLAKVLHHFREPLLVSRSPGLESKENRQEMPKESSPHAAEGFRMGGDEGVERNQKMDPVVSRVTPEDLTCLATRESSSPPMFLVDQVVCLLLGQRLGGLSDQFPPQQRQCATICRATLNTFRYQTQERAHVSVVV
jgi:hypothetical protein